MSELTFTKSFLSNLDSKPSKYAADYIFPRESFTPRTPYTLPKLSHPPYPLPPQTSSQTTPAPGSAPAAATITVILKSSKNPPLDIQIPDVNTAETTIADLKESVRKEVETKHGATVDVSKVKILYNKKPIPPSKITIEEAVNPEDVTSGKPIELGIMILGGVTSTSSLAQASTPTISTPSAVTASGPDPMEGISQEATQDPAQGPHGPRILETEEFWVDLQGFLEQRLKDEAEAARLKGVFREALKR